jgi:hypothetical protein
MGTSKLGELPWHNPLGFFCLGRSLKIQIEIKWGVVYVGMLPLLPKIKSRTYLLKTFLAQL